jgi:hypothetical protein
VQWDLKTHKKLKLVSDHQKAIADMQAHRDGTMFITASKVPLLLVLWNRKSETIFYDSGSDL